MERHKLNLEIRKLLKVYLLKGYSLVQIANCLEFPINKIRRELRNYNGNIEDYDPEIAQQKSVERQSKLYRRYLSLEDRKFIQKNLSKMTYTQIAKHINFDMSTVSKEIKKWGMCHETYDAELAQKLNNEKKIRFCQNQGMDKRRPTSPPSTNMDAIEKKIQNLEQQLEIILDFIQSK